MPRTLSEIIIGLEEIREEIKNFLDFNENENITYQNLWDIVKTVLRGMFIAILKTQKYLKYKA
jgi:hypothetical protein